MKEAIINILKKWGCHHKWESYFKEMKVREFYDAKTHEKTPEKMEFFKEIFICKDCGKIKQIEY